VAERAETLSLSAVQLHGDEDEAYIAELKGTLPGHVEVWKVVRVGGDLPELDICGGDRVLLDTASDKVRGGSGKTFDWSLIPTEDLERAVLGGGLNASNAEAADALGAWAIDVNSGVEAAPGEKSEERLCQFFNELRGQGGQDK
jgi:indole-3-glycerol phosphate synthase/phosphoribosylanthranilate isomerase